MLRTGMRLAVLSLVVAAAGLDIAGVKTTYEQVKKGSGAKVERGSTVKVHATGTVAETEKKFWSTKDAGQVWAARCLSPPRPLSLSLTFAHRAHAQQPFEYQAGMGKVIKGWDQGCLGMRVGEVRTLRIPSDEGYGAAGFPAWGIPKDATLLFEIEVLEIKADKEL